jgi:hypothetical protein
MLATSSAKDDRFIVYKYEAAIGKGFRRLIRWRELQALTYQIINT